MVNTTNIAWKSLGTNKEFLRPESELENLIFRRSIYFVQDLKAGEKVTKNHIRRIRPGYGISPKYYYEIIGKTLSKDAYRGDAVKWDFFK